MEHEELKKELISISKIIDQYPDNLKLNVFEILTQSYLKSDFKAESSKTPITSQDKNKESSPLVKEIKKSTIKKANNESYKIDRDLNLRGDSHIKSFKEFYEEKKPTSRGDFNVLAIYYLLKILGLTHATIDQVYTCYAEVKFKPAENFKQSFIDTKNKQGYIEYDKNWNLYVPHRGVVFIEHDLPKNKDKK